MKLAVLQMSDTPQIESSAVMLRHAGYDVRVCSAELARELQKMCLEVVVQVESAYGYGCDELDPTIGRATVDDMGRPDLYCDIKVNNFARVFPIAAPRAGRYQMVAVPASQAQTFPEALLLDTATGQSWLLYHETGRAIQWIPLPFSAGKDRPASPLPPPPDAVVPTR